MAVSPVYKFVAVFIDFEGEEAEVIAYVPAHGADVTSGVLLLLDEWATALVGLTTAKLKRQFYVLEVYKGAGTPNKVALQPYVNIEDKLQLVFQSTENGATFLNKIPCPKAACFGPDGETYDPFSIFVNEYKEFVETNCATLQGGQTLFLTKGYLRRMPTRRTLRQGIAAERGG